ncbi:hypothetical protein D9M68_847420 [compost metagenome]
MVRLAIRPSTTSSGTGAAGGALPATCENSRPPMVSTPPSGLPKTSLFSVMPRCSSSRSRAVRPQKPTIQVPVETTMKSVKPAA